MSTLGRKPGRAFNASIIWNWPHQTDHTRVIGDFLFDILTTQDKWSQPTLPACREIVRDTTDPIANASIQEHIADYISQRKVAPSDGIESHR